MAKKKPLPYWLDGTEICAVCEHPYVLQAEFRCTACDRPNCEHCVVVNRETGEILCHACEHEEQG